MVFNLSSLFLSATEKSALAKGLQFCITPNKVDYCKFLSPFEKLYRKLESIPSLETPTLESLQSQLKGLALHSLESFDSKSLSKNLSKNEWLALKSLSRNKEIIVCKPDKGNGVVVIDQKDYVSKLQSLLADTSKFKPLSQDPLKLTLSREEKLRKFLRTLIPKGSLTEGQYHDIAPSGSHPGRLYGLPKIHKPEVPVRPIMSATNTVSYLLAKFLVPILKPITSNEFTLTDTFDFVSQLHSSKFPAEICMASFDVTSLFTQIPLKETLNICISQLFPSGVQHVLGFTKGDLRKLLELAVYENHFLFDGILYDQADGVAMGSPLGPTLANAFLCFHESNWLADCPLDFKPIFYHRYIDDTFLVFSSPDHILPFQQYLNQKHANIKFTVERESEKCLAFLDVHVKREMNSFVTSIFRKRTFSGLYTQFESFMPSQYKFGLVGTLLHRAFRICSNYELVHKEFQVIRDLLYRNGFPLAVLDRLIGKFWLRKYENPIAVSDTVPKQSVVVSMPFLGKFSFDLRKRVLAIVRSRYPQIEIRFIWRPVFRMCSLFRVKDSLPQSLLSGVVYKFTCGGCNATYIGKTKRHLRVRSAEHLGVSVRTGKPVVSVQSAVRDHCEMCNYLAGFQDFKVLASSPYNYELGIFEGLLINRDKPLLNTVQLSGDLHLF